MRKGSRHTAKTRKKLREALKRRIKRDGYILSPEVRRSNGRKNRGRVAWNRGKSVPEKIRSKISMTLNGHKVSKETRRKISEAQKGRRHWNWQGGISSEPYSVDWTKDLRRAIRKRDRYTCTVCGKEPAIHCHHIDYNKKNCDPKNVVTLCNSCHSKTNINRKYWTDYFSDFVI